MNLCIYEFIYHNTNTKSHFAHDIHINDGSDANWPDDTIITIIYY